MIKKNTLNEQKCFHGAPLNEISGDEANKFPYNCIGLINYLDESKKHRFGTGFLIASDLVLTTAQNLFDPIQRIIFREHTFYSGVHGLFRKYQEPNGFKVLQEGTQLGYNNYALMKLEKKVKRKEYLTMEINYQLAHQTIFLNGYSQRYYSKYEGGRALQSASFKQNSEFTIDWHFFWHTISAEKGFSGSPLTILKKEKRFVIGIHQGFDDKTQMNKSRLITSDVAENILKWRNEMKGQQTSSWIGVFFKGETMEIEQWLQLIKPLRIQEKEIYSQHMGRQISMSSPPLHISFFEWLCSCFRQNNSFDKKVSNIIGANQIGKILAIANSQIPSKIIPVHLTQWDRQSHNKKQFQFRDRQDQDQNYTWARKKDGGWCQIISHPLPTTGIANANLKINYGQKESFVIVGVITAKRKDQDCSDGSQKQAVGYKTSPYYGEGTIDMDGQEVVGLKKELFVQNGGILVVSVNVDHQTVTFINASTGWSRLVRLPSVFHSKQLYIYATMSKRKDIVQFIQQKKFF